MLVRRRPIERRRLARLAIMWVVRRLMRGLRSPALPARKIGIRIVLADQPRQFGERIVARRMARGPFRLPLRIAAIGSGVVVVRHAGSTTCLYVRYRLS